jgi:hypothetical protein
MAYSSEQLGKMLGDFWQRGRITCPTCHAVVDTHFHAADSGEYLLIGICPRGHGDLNLNRSQDPLASSFRPWTDQDKKRLVDAQIEGRRVLCPIDGATVRMIVHRPTGGRPLIMGQCYRCGNFLDPVQPA